MNEDELRDIVYDEVIQCFSEEYEELYSIKERCIELLIEVKRIQDDIINTVQQIRLSANEQAVEVQKIGGEMIELQQIYKLTEMDKDLLAKIEKIKKIGEILS